MTRIPDKETDFDALLGSVEKVTSERLLRQKSRDFFWFSPILKPQLDDKLADAVVVPTTQEELATVASACAATRTPLTVRGGGTGNYGQAVPLAGGVVVDMTKLSRTVWVKPGAGRFEAGANLLDIDRTLRPDRWELRFHPSTRAQATIAGFVAGGAGGVGSCTWGQISDPGAVTALKVMTVEETPRLIELAGRDIYSVLHAYGVNGIITEVEVPLAPWHPWAERIFTFDSLSDAARFGRAFCSAEGIAKKLISVHDPRIPPLIKRLRAFVPQGRAMVIVMVSEPQAPAAERMAREMGGDVVFERDNPSAEAAAFDQKGDLPPIYEYSWNHTTLWALRQDPDFTYLQVRFPADRELEIIDKLSRTLGDEVIFHLEYQRRFGRVFVSSLPLVRFTTPERLGELCKIIEDAGADLADPHTFKLKDAGWKRIDAPQAQFKRDADPYDLMNPGKIE